MVCNDNIVILGENSKITGALFTKNFISMGTSCTDFLSLFVPCEDPAAFATGDGCVGDTDNLAYVRDVHGFQRLPFSIADDIERMALGHEEVGAPAHELTHTAARQSSNLLALLIIDVVPVLCLFNIRNLLLALRLNGQCQQEE